MVCSSSLRLALSAYQDERMLLLRAGWPRHVSLDPHLHWVSCCRLDSNHCCSERNAESLPFLYSFLYCEPHDASCRLTEGVAL